jgi:putative nucleotidyltransferase with HDIG domain
MKLAKRIVENFKNEKIQMLDEQFELPLCIGLVEMDFSDPVSSLEYLDRLIEAVYHAKLRGKGHIVDWKPQLMREVSLDIDFESPDKASPDIEAINVMTWRFRELKRRLSNVTLESLRLLVAAVEVRDPYTKHHSLRVASLARYIATEMLLPEKEIKCIHFAALLHDIGKIGIPDAILTKKSKLDDYERELIRQHPTIAVTILEQVRFFTNEIPLIRHHHEWMNGRGYPDGLSGKEIPLGARIIHVADSIEAMLAKRSYKESYDVDYTISQLEEGVGNQFDPEIVYLVVPMIQNNILTKLWKNSEFAETEMKDIFLQDVS